MKKQIAHEKLPLNLGRQYEQGVTEIAFDISELIEEFGQGRCELFVKRPGENESYPAKITTEGNFVKWLIKKPDVAIDGYGKAQLSFYKDDICKKECIYSTKISKSLCEVADIDAPQQEWVNDVVKVKLDAQNAAVKSESYAHGGTSSRAGEDTDNAKFYSDKAHEAITKQPKIIDGYWYVWDTDKSEYVQSSKATGENITDEPLVLSVKDLGFNITQDKLPVVGTVAFRTTITDEVKSILADMHNYHNVYLKWIDNFEYMLSQEQYAPEELKRYGMCRFALPHLNRHITLFRSGLNKLILAYEHSGGIAGETVLGNIKTSAPYDESFVQPIAINPDDGKIYGKNDEAIILEPTKWGFAWDSIIDPPHMSTIQLDESNKLLFKNLISAPINTTIAIQLEMPFKDLLRCEEVDKNVAYNRYTYKFMSINKSQYFELSVVNMMNATLKIMDQIPMAGEDTVGGGKVGAKKIDTKCRDVFMDAVTGKFQVEDQLAPAVSSYDESFADPVSMNPEGKLVVQHQNGGENVANAVLKHAQVGGGYNRIVTGISPISHEIKCYLTPFGLTFPDGLDLSTVTVEVTTGDVTKSYKSDSEGNVKGVMSYYPEMKFRTETKGVIVNFDYQGDLNENLGVGKCTEGIDYGDLGKGQPFAEAFNNNMTNKAIGSGSHAEGNGTTAKGNFSHAEGNGTTAKGNFSHAEGAYTSANEYYSHAEGNGTRAIGSGSHAEGVYTSAEGYFSHAEGNGTIAKGESQHVQGRYNIIEDTASRYADIVGNGKDDNNRSNAHTLDWDGNSWYQGDVLIGGKDMDDPNAISLKKLHDEIVPAKIDKNQGIENNGKILGINELGEVVPVVKPEGGNANDSWELLYDGTINVDSPVTMVEESMSNNGKKYNHYDVRIEIQKSSTVPPIKNGAIGLGVSDLSIGYFCPQTRLSSIGYTFIYHIHREDPLSVPYILNAKYVKGGSFEIASVENVSFQYQQIPFKTQYMVSSKRDYDINTFKVAFPDSYQGLITARIYGKEIIE